MSEESTGALGGAAQGAQAGMAFGPYGAIIGAVVGGIFGGLAGGKQRKARLAYNKAQKLQRNKSYADAAVERRDLYRQWRMARAASVAAAGAESGGLMSSAPMGAISSIGSQGKFNTEFFDVQFGRLVSAQKLYDKSGKLAKQAGDINALFQMGVSAAGAMGGGFGGGAPSSGGSYGSSSLAGPMPVAFGGTYMQGTPSMNLNSYNGFWGNNAASGWGVRR